MSAFRQGAEALYKLMVIVFIQGAKAHLLQLLKCSPCSRFCFIESSAAAQALIVYYGSQEAAAEFFSMPPPTC